MLEWVWGLLALGTVTLTVLGWFNPDKVAQVIAASRDGALPISVFVLPFVIEVEGMRLWHWLSVASAAMTLLTILWLQAIFAYEKAGSQMDHRDWQVWTVFYLERIRTITVIALLVVALYTTVDFMHAQCGLPNWMNSVLELHFNPVCPKH